MSVPVPEAFARALADRGFRQALDGLSVDVQELVEAFMLRETHVLDHLQPEDLPLLMSAVLGWILGFSGAQRPSGPERQAEVMRQVIAATYTAGICAHAVGGPYGFTDTPKERVQ
jgi:hypothetical protein